MQIELHPTVAKNLLDYLLNAKKRAEFVVAKKDKYDQAAVERAEHVVSLLTPVCNALQKGMEEKQSFLSETIEKGTSLEDRMEKLETSVQALNQAVLQLRDMVRGRRYE